MPDGIFSGLVSIVIMIIPCFSFQGDRGLTGPPGPPGRPEEVGGPSTTIYVSGPPVCHQIPYEIYTFLCGLGVQIFHGYNSFI